MSKKLFSIVIPIYKAVANIPHTIPYMLEQIPVLFPDYDVEIVMVCDGSPDDSWSMMKEYQQKYPETIRIARFVNNYGQPLAISHGIKMSRGDVIGVISQDLQDPFEMFVDMLAAIEAGHDFVCCYRERREEKGLYVACARLARWMMRKFISPKFPKGGCDFYMMARSTADRLFDVYRKDSLLLALMEASSSILYIPYTRREREHGKSGYSFMKKVNALIHAFVSNTYLPLRVMSVAGFVFAGAAFLFALVVFVFALFQNSLIPVQGWASTALLITFFSGLNLASLGILGEYLWRVFDEVKKKPLYLVAETIEDEKADTHAGKTSD